MVALVAMGARQQPRHRLVPLSRQKLAATIHALVAVAKNTRNATAHKRGV